MQFKVGYANKKKSEVVREKERGGREKRVEKE